MSQETAKIHQLFAVPSPEENAPQFERQYSAPEEMDVCAICFGTGMEIVPGRGARTCECRKQKAHTVLLDKAKIPRRYLDCHFNNYKIHNPTQERARNYASRLANTYPAIDRGLLFMGTVGVGKTHLAVSILKGLTERGFSCLFYEFGSLLKEIQSSYNPVSQVSEFSVLSPIFQSEILVLDEIGASKPTEWVRDTMANIINTRYNDQKLTIFTTNYLDNRRSEKDETLEDRIGVRLRSRLFEMCKTVLVGGDDYRRNFDHVTQIKK